MLMWGRGKFAHSGVWLRISSRSAPAAGPELVPNPDWESIPARLQQATGAAVSTLLKIMVDSNAPPSTRVRAADSVLDHARQAIEIEDIDVRVAALEHAAEVSKEQR